MGLFSKLLMLIRLRRRGTPPPPGPPITSTFTSIQVAPGFSGPISLTKVAGRLHGVAVSTIWAGTITGTDADIQIMPGDGADYENINVSVDGGAFVLVVRGSGVCVLFAGLSDAPHFVVWRYGPAWSADPFVASIGNILNVTGVSPALEVSSDWMQAGDDFAAAALTTTDANYIPLKGVRVTGPTHGASTAGLGFRGEFAYLTLISAGTHVMVSVDGAAPSIVAIPANQSHCGIKWTCPSGTHDYYVWSAGSSMVFPYQLTFAVGTVEAKSALVSQKRLHHFGHSIVEGPSATSTAHTDMGRTAARNGYVFGQFGRSSNNINDLFLRIPTLLADLVVGVLDVAILDIGRNDGTDTMTAGQRSDYEAIIQACLTKGYSLVLCLGVMSDAGYTPVDLNASIQDMVSDLTDPAVVFVDRSMYTGIDKPDGTHPSDAGYVTIDEFNQTHLDPLL